MNSTPFSLEKLRRCQAFYRQHPGGIVTISWTSQWTRADFRRWFMGCLNRKMQRYDPQPVTRKYSEEYYLGAIQTAIRVNQPRAIVRASEIPKEFRARLYHRLTHPRDEAY